MPSIIGWQIDGTGAVAILFGVAVVATSLVALAINLVAVAASLF